MFCARCQKDIPWCTCGDIEKRLKQLAKTPALCVAAKQNLNVQKIQRAKEA